MLSEIETAKIDNNKQLSRPKWSEAISILLENTSDFITLQDLEFNILKTNKIVKTIYGDIIGEKCYKVFHGSNEKCSNCYVEKTVLTGIAVFVDERSISTGQIMQSMAYPIKDKRGNISGIIIHSKDITGRKNAEVALRDNERNFHSLLEDSPSAIVISKGRGDVIYANREMLNLFGFSSVEEMQNTPLEQRYPPEEMALLRKRIDKRLRGESTLEHFEYRIVRKTGEIRYVEVFNRKTRWNGEECIQVIYNDITERRRARDTLQKSERKFRSLVNNIRLGVLRATPEPDGRFLEVNPAMKEITGYSRNELLKMKVADLYVFREDRTQLLNEIALFNNNERKITKEIRLRKKDGTEIICSDTKVPIYDGNHNILYFDGIIEDVTEQKLREQKLRKSYEDLSALSVHLSRVREDERAKMARVFHDDFGQLLTALKIDIDWLFRRIPHNEEPLVRKIKLMLELVDTAIQTVKRLSTQLRPKILDDLGLVAAIEWQIAEFQERTKFKCESSLPSDDITIDIRRATAVFRIFQEILTNIARHSLATEFKVKLQFEDEQISLEISDNGIGISDEQISSPASFGILGIKERVKYWQGEFSIRGLKGKGTNVRVCLPNPAQKEKSCDND